ncbi:MAG TPA: carboxylate--amine ligase/circularly permuted type 2 ATP-grasp protein [Polyangiaceae bacterium]|jgi:carboxylate-amine ligase|nr:carboxylate--amine ligase/circularly permuted type 2 ATP-grasp protein [Polyangiaceae bacterium]
MTANSETLTLGVEEEFHLVDLRTRRITPRAREVLANLADSSRTYAAELQQSVVETNSPVFSTLSELRRGIAETRQELARVAGGLGIGVAAAGTLPMSTREVKLTDAPRYQRMLADYQLLVREQSICGMQVHVGVGDRDLAAKLLDRLARYLPPLLALSTSSPFAHDGNDTGYASSRSLIWSRWPTTGAAGAMHSADEYETLVRDLVASGVISDPGMIYFDVRPSSHLPTIEMRVCDACHSVDTVALIAGLFRAAVAHEIAQVKAGNPAMTVHPIVQRAALWRAARSGLEGELVDLRGPKPLPAALVLRAMVDELAPELAQSGDEDFVRTLVEDVLSRQSAAARQRDALRSRGRLADVVDLILAETRGETHHATARANTVSLASGYEAPAFDEALLPDGQPRPSHAAVLRTLAALGPDELRVRAERLALHVREAGVLFRPTDAKEARPFPLDIVPRVLTGEEWSRLEGGTAQRARALDAFLNDIYGEQSIVRDGVLPAWLVEGAPGRRDAGTTPAPGARRAQVCGFDVVRDADGRWLVLEDNVRIPSGVAYAMQSRRLLKQVFPELDGSELHDVERVPALLRRTLEESAPPHAQDELSIIVLSEGSDDSASFEHRMLARAMSLPVAVPAELFVEDDTLFHVTDGKAHRVDIVYLRMDDSLAHRRGKDGRVIGPRLSRAVQAGRLTLANALGNGIADDKAVYDYVPKFIDYYLDERPLLEQVPTYHCSDPEQRALVLSRLGELVVKPVDGYGGMGVVIGPQASDEELAAARSVIEQQPSRYIAQETIALSTHPTYHDGALEPRHVDLRVFVYYGKTPVVVPAALTRVASAGSLVVNSSRGGGAKDTWLYKC